MSSNIYHQAIKQLAAAETGAGKIDDADVSVTLDNPFCGDRVTLYLKMENNHIQQVSHHVRGCLLCKATASIIGSAAQGCNEADINKLTQQLATMLKENAPIEWPDKWQALSYFEPVQSHKSRHECVLLPLKALSNALQTSQL